MSRPVGSASSNPTEVNFNEIESEPFMAPPARSLARTQSQVEPWTGSPVFNEPTFNGPTNSGADLAAQSARAGADRQRALKALTELDVPLAKLAAKFPDPDTAFRTKDVAFGSFGDAIHTDDFTRAASTLPASDLRPHVEAQVKKAWPQSTPEQTEKLKQYFMGQIAESLRERVAPQLQKLATTMLEDASKSFFKTATDPAEIEQLSKRLNEMAHPLAAPGDQASVRDLRAAMGLGPDDAKVTPEKLTVALYQRAALLEHEATKMKHHARGVLFRELASQDVGPLFKQSAGIKEGSMLAAQIDEVKAQGENETHRLGYVKLASIAIAGGLTGGLALGGAGISGAVVGVGVTSSLATPSVLHAWEAVDTAKASESAGTMKAGAGEEAHRRAVIETAAAAASVAAATGVNHALHGALLEASSLTKVGVHGAVEFAAEFGSEQAGHGLHAALSSEGQATGKNALERARPAPSDKAQRADDRPVLPASQMSNHLILRD